MPETDPTEFVAEAREFAANYGGGEWDRIRRACDLIESLQAELHAAQITIAQLEPWEVSPDEMEKLEAAREKSRRAKERRGPLPYDKRSHDAGYSAGIRDAAGVIANQAREITGELERGEGNQQSLYACIGICSSLARAVSSLQKGTE